LDIVFLITQPNITKKLLEELKEANVPTDGTVPSWSVINNLPYMTQVLKESLRLRAVAPAFARQLKNDEKYKDITLPAGTQILCNLTAIHLDPRNYPCSNVNEFNPDHFSPENVKNRHAFAFIPFAAGPRNCLGMQFALVEARTIFAYLLPRFELKLVKEPKVVDRAVVSCDNMMMKPELLPV